MGNLYQTQAELAEAEISYLQKLEEYQQMGAEHPLMLKTLVDLGHIFARQGKLDEAENMFVQALEAKEKVLGPRHALTIETMNDLGRLYRSQGNMEKAEEIYQRVLELRVYVYGAPHMLTREVLNSLFALYSSHGRLTEAEITQTWSIEGYVRTLEIALRGEHEELVLKLLNTDMEVNVDAQYRLYNNALQEAVAHGYATIVRLLLNRGADVNAQGGQYGNALQAAAAHGYETIIQLLLERGADVNAQGGKYGNALQAATVRGDRTIIQLLLNRGANVNAQGGQYDNALQAATARGYVAIVQFLLDEGADINAQGGQYGSALHAATVCETQNIIQFLLDRGADINAPGGPYGTPLQTAVARGQGNTIQFLLDKGADVNTQGGSYSNALQTAAVRGYQNIVQLLLQMGARVNAQGGYYGNALNAAVLNDHRAIVELLIASGAHTEGQSKQDSNPLRATAVEGHQKVIPPLQDTDEVSTLDKRLESGRSSFARLPSSDLHLAEEIALFLLKNTYFQSLITQATQRENRAPGILQRLQPLIKRYGQDLKNTASNSTHLAVIWALTTNAHHVAGAILENFTKQREARIEIESSLRKDCVPAQARMSSAASDVLLQFSIRSTVDQEPDDSLAETEFLAEHQPTKIGISEIPTGESKPPHLRNSKPVLEEVRHYMASENQALEIFLGLLSRMVYSDPLQAVEHELLRGLGDQSEPFESIFNVAWEVNDYLEQEVVGSENGKENEHIFRSLLVLCGNSSQCFADSCQTYMKWKWPESAEVLLETLDRWSKIGNKSKETRKLLWPLEHVTSAGTIHVSDETELTQGLQITAFGTQSFLVDIAQQLSWITASIRLPIYGKVSYSDVLFFSTGRGVYKAVPLPLETAEDEKPPCWLPLFLGTVIAQDYPIPKRDQENGLELPFHLMTSLAGALYPMAHDGGIYLKGYSRLLFPTSSFESGSIQWHLITSPSRQEKLPPGTIHDQSWQRIGDVDRLKNARTFLGYCRKVVVDLGTKQETGYYRDILFSSVRDENRVPSVQPPSSITWGTAGMGIFGATMTHTLNPGRALTSTACGVHLTYLDVLGLAMDTPVILYDHGLESRRGWMVPALSVILHMIHTWAAQNGTGNGPLPYSELTWKAGEAARSILTEKWNFVLRDTPSEEMDKKKLVKDLVMQYWDGIHQRQGEDLKARYQSTPGLELASSKLYGWDYMDIVTGEHSCRRQLHFDGNWRELTEDAMVLFCQNLGNVIRPAPGISICEQWDPIPSGKAYLTATIDCLRQLSWERGGHRDILTGAKLTNKGYWNHRTNDLFADCKRCSRSDPTESARCSKLPQSLDKSADERSSSLVPPSEGAIVFGSIVKRLHKADTANLQARPANADRVKYLTSRCKVKVKSIIRKPTATGESLPSTRALDLSLFHADRANGHITHTEEAPSTSGTRRRDSI
jgi:ankyrin repeat protein